MRHFTISTAGWKENAAVVDIQGRGDHGFSDATERENICKAWHTNATALHAQRDIFATYATQGDAGKAVHEAFQKAYDIVLFCLLHEPIKTGASVTRSFYPSVPDPEDLLRRIDEGNQLRYPGVADSHFHPFQEFVPLHGMPWYWHQAWTSVQCAGWQLLSWFVPGSRGLA